MTEINETQSIFANEDSFRAELAKLNEESQEVSSVPEDIKQAQEEQSQEVPTESEEQPEEVQASEDAHDEGTEEPVKGHLIPKSRFNQELEKRKSLEEQLTKEREELIKYKTQLEMISGMQQAQQQQQMQQHQQQNEIDPLDVDTYNYAKQQIEELNAKVAKLSEQSMQQSKEVYAVNRLNMEERNFTEKHPDFQQALNHVRQVEMNIAKDFVQTEEEAQAFVAQKMHNILNYAIETGRNSAETIYNMAKNYGYISNPTTNKAVPTKNIQAISKNMEKSANINSVGNVSNFNNVPTDISAALNKKGNFSSGVNPDLFHKVLERIQN